MKAVLGIMSFAVLLGAVLGNTAVKSGALVAALFVLLALGLPSGYDAYFEPIGVGEDGFASARSVDESGQTVFSVECSDVPLRKTVGMRLEVKGRGVLA